MKIAVLSQNPGLYLTSRLLEAGEELGHEMSVVNYLACEMHIAAHKPTLTANGEQIEGLDAAIARVSASSTFYGTAVVRQLEMMGVYLPNSSQAIARSRDKLRSLQLLSRRGIAMPVTAFGHTTQDVKGLIRGVGGAPLVVKLLEGAQGIGVVLCETDKAAESVIEAFRNLDANILVQEFIAEAGGADLRCYVVGNKVVAAMKRQAPPGEFRSNIHRGGEGQKVKLTPEERSVAVRAAKAMKLGIAGVDIIRSNHGPLVIEVNSSPGLEGIERATGVDVAGKVISWVAKRRDEGAGRKPDV